MNKRLVTIQKEDASKDIESHNKMFGKDSGKKEIVWTGDME